MIFSGDGKNESHEDIPVGGFYLFDNKLRCNKLDYQLSLVIFKAIITKMLKLPENVVQQRRYIAYNENTLLLTL